MSERSPDHLPIYTPEFIDALFMGLHTNPLEDEFIALCPKRNQTKLSSSLTRFYGLQFFCVSTINGETITKPGTDGGADYTYIGRTRDNLVKAYCLVLDDIGTKAQPPDVLPHWRMETSPGNEQWGYFLVPEDLRDPESMAYYEACVRSVADAGYSDNGAGGSYRIMRLPSSRKDGSDYKAGLVHWAPSMPRYGLHELMTHLALKPVYPENKVRAQLGADEVDDNVSFEQWVSILCDSCFHLYDLSRRVADVLHLLTEISPDLPYADWLSVGMALKTLPNDGFSYRVFQKWSAQGSSYDPSEWPDKWHSFSAEKKGAVSLSSIFYLAKKQRLPMYEEPVPSSAVLFKELNKRCGYVSFEKVPRVIVSPSLLDEFLLPGVAQWMWFGLQSFVQHFATLRTTGVTPEDPPLGKVPQRWLDSRWRTTYAGVQLAAPPTRVKEGLFNLWQGFSVEPTHGDVSLFENHIRNVLGAESEECGEYLVRYFAWAVQNPGSVSGVMVVLKGGRGTGKSMVSDALRNIFGAHGKIIDHDDGVTGRFNRALEGALFVSLEEAGWAGDKKGQGKLKNLITGKTIQIEPKGCDPYEVTNGAKIVLTTNHEWAVPAAGDERRFAVFEVSDRYQQQKEYFGPLAAMLKLGLGDVLGWLQSYELGDWHPGDNIPKTRALHEQQNQSAVVSESYVKAFFLDELSKLEPFHPRLRMDETLNGMDVYGEGLIRRGVDEVKHGEYEYWIPKKWFHQEVLKCARRRNFHTEITMNRITREMKKLFPEDTWSMAQIAGKGVRGYYLPRAEVLEELLGVADSEEDS